MAKKSRQQQRSKAAGASAGPMMERTSARLGAGALETPPVGDNIVRMADTGSNSSLHSISAFWFQFSVPWQKIGLLRVCMFALLAIDALLQIRHAPRYGAGGFNVAHISWLDNLHPSRESYAIAQMVLAFCFSAVACGAAIRVMLTIATPLYSWLYFSSQVDSYQHHYLVALLLFLSCFVKWQPNPAAKRSLVRSMMGHNMDGDGATDHRGGWALRLMLVQLAIMYLWAAVSKCNAAWWSGDVMSQQITGAALTIIHKIGGFSIVSPLVILSEFALSTLLWHRRGWPIALVVGVPLHAGIIVSGLEVGVFAWLMLALYILVMPDRWLQRLRLPMIVSIENRNGGLLLAACGAALLIASAIAVGLLCRFPNALAVFITASITVVGLSVVLNRRSHQATLASLTTPLIAAILFITVDRASDVAYDYYRFWASTESRFGNATQAKELYRQLTVRFPDIDNGYYQLAKLQAASKDAAEIADALLNAQQAQRLAPTRARSFLLAARILVAQGDRANALLQVQSAVAVEPDNNDAVTLQKQLSAAP